MSEQTTGEYFYKACCVKFEGDDITAMVEKACQVSHRTMKLNCPDLDGWAKMIGYARDIRYGITLKKDRHVTYWKSIFKGKKCYFLVHSAIEYVWTKIRDN